MRPPWFLEEIYAQGLLQAPWQVSWVAARERNYVCELVQGSQRVIAKVVRPGPFDPASRRLLSNEYRVLQSLEELAGIAPKPLGCIASTGIWLQQGVAAKPARGRDVLRHPQLRRHVLAYLGTLMQSFERKRMDLSALIKEQPAFESLAGAARAAALSLEGKVFSAFAHNDLNPHNLLFGEESVTMIDWTFARVGETPGFDWFDMLAHSAQETGGWLALSELLRDRENSLTQMCLEGAAKLVGCPEQAGLLLELYRHTRLRNLQQRLTAA